MKKRLIVLVICVAIISGIGFVILQNDREVHIPVAEHNAEIKLPEPVKDSDTSIEEALLERRSIRSYKDKPLTVAEVSQLLWAAQGITVHWGGRTAPSAGATYPLEVYVVVGNVNNLSEGIYKYKPHEHELVRVAEGDKRVELCDAALGQRWVGEGAIVIVFSAVYGRTTERYGDRGIRYVHTEAGHAAQNVYLQAVSLNLGTVVVGAFYDDEVKKIVNMHDEECPLYIMPVGRV
jgi:SagB-type dehydrogenase family enzyme